MSMKCSLSTLNFLFYTFYPLKDKKLRIFPNVDGHFLKKHMDELLQKHELLTVPFMIGVNNDEAGWSLAAVSVNITEICVTEEITDFQISPWKHDCFALVHVWNVKCLPLALCSSKLDRGIRSGVGHERDVHVLP